MTAPAAPSPATDLRTVAVDRRFADLDVLGHVNNVRYLDYVAVGRDALLREHGLEPAAATVLRHRIGFVAPMTFGRADAEVRTGVVGVDGDAVTLSQEVVSRGHRGDEDPTLHLRTETSLRLPGADRLDPAAYVEAPRWRDVPGTDRPHRHATPLALRARDLGPDGAARDDAVMEAFQEARVRYFMDLHQQGEEWSQVVVAHTDLDLPTPVRRDAAPEVRSWLSHLGTSSFSVRSHLVDGAGTVLARADVVLVCFDATTQRPAPMRPVQRERLEQELDD